VFKKGDLIFFNTKGRTLFQYIRAENGIVMSDPYLLYEKDFESKTRMIQYYGYDVLIQGRLFKEIPEKFLLRVIKREENIE
tara:strand:+ start:507 stop:749 length:243 start_codon:yes stop_codon:yes gene_type:complete